jgi:hypothetical protein
MVVVTFDDATFVFRYQRSHLPALHSAALFGGSYDNEYSIRILCQKIEQNDYLNEMMSIATKSPQKCR